MERVHEKRLGHIREKSINSIEAYAKSLKVDKLK